MDTPLLPIIWIVCAIIGVFIGVEKGKPVIGFLAGLLLGPFGLLVLAFDRGKRVKCPYCREYIEPDALVCPRCQREVVSVSK